MNTLKHYINGAIWGLKIANKIMARCKDINKGIMILSNIQAIIKRDYKKYNNDNRKLWCAVEKIIYNIK